MIIKIKEASLEHQDMGWFLDYHTLLDIQTRYQENLLEGDAPSLEEIEAVLLIAMNKEHLVGEGGL